MDELMDNIAADGSSSQISDQLKDMLYAKSAERVNAFRPQVATSVFNGNDEVDAESEEEIVDEN
jgi:hypothetical protein|tara:strand:+ start:869 stop:1060 length:192 start_codon:yes stop_codon:yes gene_type:complete